MRQTAKTGPLQIKRIAVFVILVVITILALKQTTEAKKQTAEANKQRVEALKQKAEADKQRDEALLTQSRFLEVEARRQRDGGDVPTGLLLALAASTDSVLKTRPYWSKAEVALEGARRRFEKL